jgi:radical SAM superfamily enzyme YgiQ (UPF0313 family)
MARISTGLDLHDLDGEPKKKTALLIAPPVYDTQYWAQWSQPYGLLRVASLLKKHQYKRIELFDFMEVREGEKAHQHRINPGEVFGDREEPNRPIQPHRITKPGDPDSLELFRYHFGKTWKEFENWMDEKEYSYSNPPDEIWISAMMTYWWEPVRDLITRLRRRFGKKTTILLGGIYPTLAPEHASLYTEPDIVVTGEVKEANELWTDLSLYQIHPTYAILTPSRGCPNNCAYCAQKTINDGRIKVEFREPKNVYAEMRDKWEKFGIRDFAFYADFLLWEYDKFFIPLLEMIGATKDVKFRIYAPEGLDVRYLSQSQKLVDALKKANLQKVYLPCESIDEEYIKTLNRKHVKLEHFVKAAKMCEKAGFPLRNMDVNAFLLYGLPGESVDRVVKSIMFVSEIVGSIIPMLFTPVPSTQLYKNFLPFIQERGWDRDLQMLNGKLFPFLEMNEGSVHDYVDMQRLMFTLNSHYRNNSFQLFGDTKVSMAVRDNVRNGFEQFIQEYKKEPKEEFEY